MIDTIIGDRYKLLDAIGEGTHALVYRAFDPVTSKDVAIKRYRLPISLKDRPDVNALGEYEAKIYQQLETVAPTIAPRCLAKGYDRGMIYLVLDLLPGQTLRAYGATLSTLPSWRLPDLVQVMFPVAQALAELHRHSIIHRDIKPENIMLLPDKTIQIVDWSIAFSREYWDEFPSRARPMGTKPYCPPEISNIRSWPTPAYDAYSFGRMLQEFAKFLHDSPPLELRILMTNLTCSFPENRPSVTLVAQHLSWAGEAYQLPLM